MGLIGGELGYRLLKKIGRPDQPLVPDGGAYADSSKLEVLMGPGIWAEVAGKVVLDFGAGAGREAIEMASRGARRVIGLEIQEDLIAVARESATRLGVADRCVFGRETAERVDVVTAIDSFEHFNDPAEILCAMHRLVKREGCVLVSFGPTWFHPRGGHLFSVFPWAHLVFTEAALIRWRSDFKADGARCFSEVAGGLNQMTIARFERIVGESPFKFDYFEAVPIRSLRPVANRFTREFTTAIVRCRLVPR